MLGIIPYLCNMISKAEIKLIRSLNQKKWRMREGLFVAEGSKVVGDLMKVYQPVLLCATRTWFQDFKEYIGNQTKVVEILPDELHKISFLQHPQEVLGVFPTMDFQKSDINLHAEHELCLALDGVQDPGNMGTIIRIADWFGIKHLYCSEDTVDLYNPKVVQATMGSIAHVSVIYTSLPNFILSKGKHYPVYGTMLEGTSIYEQKLESYGMIVMGNEGRGLSEPVRSLITQKLLIPSFPAGTSKADSLNVAVASAIVCSEFRRRYM